MDTSLPSSFSSRPFPPPNGGFACDSAALESFYEEHGAHVYGLCRRMLGSESDAQDAVQEVFLKVFERANQFAGRARFGTWLHRLTVNHCLNQIERERLRVTEPFADEADLGMGSSEDPRDLAQRSEDADTLHKRLQSLAPEQRDALVLRELEGHSYAEIADILGIPEGTVMSRIARAREKLWRLYGKASTSQPHDDCAAKNSSGSNPPEDCTSKKLTPSQNNISPMDSSGRADKGNRHE